MSIQLQSKVLMVVLEKIEHLTVIKNEPPESEIVEIGMDDILDSSEEESIEDIKDIEIVSHELSEDLIKSETVSENLFIENITQSENLNKTENTSDGNVNRGTGQGLIEVQSIDDILDSSDEESIPDIKGIKIVLHKLSEDLIKSKPVSEYTFENNHLESVETQIGIDDILDSSDEESIPDIKDIEIVLHELSEDLIKSETVSENILENNNLFIETENITQSENLNKTENTSDGNVNRGTGQGLIEVQGIDDILDSSDVESIPDIKGIKIVLHKLSEDLRKIKTVSEYTFENNHLESVETQIGIDDILDSSDEESIPDIKDVEIVLHELSEDLIKSETVSENILENNNLFIETENITQSENLNKTENTSDGNVNKGIGQGLIEVQGIDDILDSSDEESIQDIKDIEIVLHELSEDLIKSETVSENILENNNLFIETENITQSENLNKTENTSDGNVNRGIGQGLKEVQGIDDILDSSDEESIQDIKDIEIVLHELSEDLIKSETVSENILENNNLFIETENITQSENLNKTENTSDGNVNRGTGQGLIEVQGIDDILDSLDEESIQDIKNIEIVLHELSEDLIKCENVSKNLFIETENITQSENLNKTENTSDGNVNRGTGQGLIEVQGIDDILDSSDEESIQDIKDIEIVLHELSEDLIKSETVSENILENNNLFIETENISQSENLNKTENTSDGNVNRGTGQGLIEVQSIDDILDSSDEESIPDIKGIKIVLHKLSEDLIKSKTVSEYTFENNHLESVETQIGIDDILDSSDEESIPDIKDIEIVLHELSEDLIKSETVSENILENNNLFIETENITQSENLNKTENTSDGNVNRGTGQGLIEVQGIDDILDSSDVESIPDIKGIKIVLLKLSEDLRKIKTVSEYTFENNHLESVETQIGIDDILDSSDEESIPDIKDVEIVLHELSEDLIKSETVSENILENNNLFIETENITQSENLNKTENTSDGNVNKGIGQGLIEVQGIDDILDSSDEESIQDIKDIEIVLHELSEDLIKSETVSENILENNNLFIETENITQSENLNKTENTSDGNVNRGIGQGLKEVQGIDDILDSSDEESIQDIKDIEIVLHELSEDLIKSETVSENILENNNLFIETENITQSENLNKTENTSDSNVNRGTGQGLIEVQGIDDILDSSDEESIQDIKNIEIVLHELSKDLIKSENVSENLFIETENITQSENLYKTENTSDGNVNRGTGQGLIEVQGIDDILDSSDEESIPDIKDVEIVLHELSEDLIKSETVSEDILENDNLFIERENITQSENLNKTENTSDGNVNRGTGQGLIEVQGIDDIFDSSDEESIPDIKGIKIVLHKLSEDLIKSKTVSEYTFENNHLESVETQIGIDDILDSSDEESIPDIKGIKIVLHKLSEDLIKSKTVSENILENNHPESIETQILVQTENNPFMETETSENLNMTENTSDGNVNRGTGQGLIEVQGSNEHFNAFVNQTDKQHVLNFSKNLSDISLRDRKVKRSGKTDFSECNTLVKTTSYEKLKKDKEKRKVIEVSMLPVEPHESITLARDKDACNKNKSTHKKHKARYCCEKYTYTSEISSHLKLHQLTHKTKAEIDDRLLKYRCDKCKYKTSRHQDFKKHKLIHLKPEEIQLKYRCDKCKYKTFRHQDFKRHKLIHLKPEEIQLKYRCDKCKYKTFRPQDFKKHKLIHLKPEEIQLKYRCDKCNYKTFRHETLKRHKLIHLKPEEIQLKYRCDKCNYKTFRHDTLKRHKLIHLKPEEIQYFYCYHCSYKCKQKSSLKKHIFHHFKNEDVRFHCYICDFVTLKRDFIIEHFKTHPRHHSKFDETEYKYQLEICNKRYCCEKCTYTSGRSSNLKLHQLTRKTKAEIDDRLLKYRCDKCKYKTFRHHDFKRHKLIHLKPEEIQLKYRCDKCNYKTFRHGTLKRHKLIHLKPEEIQYFYCYHCSYKCKQKSSLKKHIFHHFKNEDVRFHCYICDFVTLKRDFIIEHFKTHPRHHSKFDETEYKYQLEICNKRYCCEKCTYTSGRSSNLKLHQLTRKTKAEIDDRLLKYRCDKCKYKTFRHHDFKRHKLIHLKPEEIQLKYRCDKCNYKTFRHGTLKRHKLIHLKPEEIQYFYCYHCSYKCKQKSSLKKHIFHHFKNEDVRFHCYICDFVTLKRDFIIEHFKTHPRHHSKFDETEYKYQLEICNKRYCCEKCTYTSGRSSNLKLHQLTRKTKAEIDDRLLKYRCDKCKYKTFRHHDFKRHKLIHLKPEEIQLKYRCDKCKYKTFRPQDFKKHKLIHLKPEEIQLKYRCDKCKYKTFRHEHFKRHKLIHFAPTNAN